jgi:glycosyltransferase involved in cell wall biosynthesis
MTSTEKKPLVSIAVATYNGAEFLSEQLDSLVRQTWRNIEIIISDDASTDTTPVIAAKYAKKYPFIRFLRQKRNLGYIANFEAAVKKCKGEFIALCDQDDIWRKDKIEILMNIIGKKDIAASDLRVIDGRGKLIAPSLEKYQGLFVPLPEEQYRILVFRNCFTGCAMLIRKSLIKKCIPIPKEALVHDWWFAVNAAARNGIAYTRETLVDYRQHGKNAIGAKDKKKTKKESALRIFLPSRRHIMKQRFSSFEKRIFSYLESGIVQKEDVRFLQEVLRYYRGYSSISGKAAMLYYGIKHHRYIYKNQNIFRVIFNLTGKMI